MRKDHLIRIGLTSNEAEIYLALLELGPSLVSKIVSKTRLNRTNIYDLLEKLISKGLVSYVIKNNRKNFVASKPSNILRYIEEKENKLLDEKTAAKEMIPELEAIRQSDDKESVEVYDGKEGLKTVLEEIASSKKEILTYGSRGNFSSNIKYYFNHYLARLKKSRVKMKVVFSANKKHYPLELDFADVRYVPESYRIPTETTIFGDNVVIFVFTEKPRAILIRSRSVAVGYRTYFDILWKSAKK